MSAVQDLCPKNKYLTKAAMARTTKARIRIQPMTFPSAMGSGEAINVHPLGAGKVAITGDFVLIASEVNPVLRTLRANGTRCAITCWMRSHA